MSPLCRTAPRALSRLPGGLLLLALLSLLVACKTSPAPSSTSSTPRSNADQGSLPTAPPISRSTLGQVRVIQKVDWKAGPFGVSLVGVDADKRQAILLLTDNGSDSPRLAIDTVSLQSGDRLDRWEASSTHAREMVLGYPGFRGMDGASFEEDLLRYATLLHGVGDWTYRETTPPLGVLPSPSLDLVVYGAQPADGKDGDWLMTLNPISNRTSRLDYGLRASYHPSFSPDGQWIAWIGGSADYAHPGRQIGYVLRIARTDRLKHRAVSRVRDLLRTPIWSHDSKTIYAFGKQGKNQCLFGIEVSGAEIEELYCHANNFDIMLSPRGDRALLLLPASDEAPQRLVTHDFATGEEIMQMEVDQVQGLGAFGVWLDGDHFALLSDLGSTLQILHTTTGEEIARHTLASKDSIIHGRHGMKIVDGELIALRQHLQTNELELIALRIR